MLSAHLLFFMEKIYDFMHFERISPFKMHKIIYFPTLPNIFRPVTQNTLIFYLASFGYFSYRQAQASVLEGVSKLHKLGVKTKRPEDYFAEMAKTDDHMKKVKKYFFLNKTLIFLYVE